MQLFKRIFSLIHSILYPPRPRPVIEKKQAVCPNCRALHNMSFVDGRPMGGQTICEPCLNKAIFGDLEEQIERETINMLRTGSKL